MNNLRIWSLLCSFPALLLAALPSHADPVDLSVSGHLYGAYALAPNTSVTENFTLNQATLVSSFQAGIAPEDPISGILDGSYEVTLTGPGGTYALDETSANGMLISSDWITSPDGDVLPEGTYTLSFIGGSCGTPDCDEVAAIDYYEPDSYTQIGGSILGGDFGFDLVGQTVTAQPQFGLPDTAIAPEPATWVLLTSGAVAMFAILGYRRRKA